MLETPVSGLMAAILPEVLRLNSGPRQLRRVVWRACFPETEVGCKGAATASMAIWFSAPNSQPVFGKTAVRLLSGFGNRNSSAGRSPQHMRSLNLVYGACVVLLVTWLSSCGPSGHGEPPERVSGTTIEQAMGLPPKVVEVRADQRVAARASAQTGTPPAPATASTRKLTPSRPAPETLPRKATPAAEARMPVQPVRKVAAAPLPDAAPAGVIRIFLQARNPQTGSRTFAISSDRVPEDEMIRVIPDLPALTAQGTRMTGFAYIDGNIVLEGSLRGIPIPTDALENRSS